MSIKSSMADYPIHSAIIAEDNVEIIKCLLNESTGNDISKFSEVLLIKNDDGFTPLKLAVEYNRIQIADFLLPFLSNISNEPLLLHIAAHKNYRKIVNLLLKYGWDASRVDGSGNTPLLIATSLDNYDAFEALLDTGEGQSLKIQSKKGFTVLHAAISAKSYRIINHLNEKYAAEMKELCSMQNSFNYTPLHFAAKSMNIEILKLILPYFQNVNIHNSEKDTPLHIAIKWNFHDGVKALIENGGTKNLTFDEQKMISYWIVIHKNIEILKLFCDDLERQIMKFDKYFDILQSWLLNSIHSSFHEGVEYFLNRNDWKLIICRRPNTDSKTSPMQSLIINMPKMAEKILDWCFVENTDPRGDLIYMFFEFIDDRYYIPMTDDDCESIATKSESYICRQKEIDKVLGTPRNSFSLYHDDEEDRYNSLYEMTFCAYDDDDYKLKSEAKSIHSYYNEVVEEHPLKLMLTYKRDELLSHKLVESYITEKWNRFKMFYYLCKLNILNLLSKPSLTVDERVWWNGSLNVLFFHFVFVLSVTYAIMNLPPKMILMISEINETLNTNSLNQKCLSTSLPRFFITFMGLIHSIMSVYKLWRRFNLLRRLLDIVIFGLIFSLLFCKHFDYSVEWNIMLTLNLCVWAAFINVFKKVPRFGIYILMIFQTLKQFLRFVPIISLFLTPFAVTFFVSLDEERNLFTLFKRIIKLTAMMTGELDYDGNVNNITTLLNCFIFFSFLLIFTIFLMNILIGLAVSDTAATLKKAYRLRMKLQIETILHIESLMPESLRRYFWRGGAIVIKDSSEDKESFKSLFRWFGLSKEAMYKLYQSSENHDHTDAEALL